MKVDSQDAETDTVTTTGDQSDTDMLAVGIGASAGGLEALELFFAEMPREIGVAFVVVQHLSPHHKSFMVELLSRSTPLSVRHAEDGMKLERDCVHLIPPKKNMTIRDGTLRLVDQPARTSLNLPIDIFFRSLAEDAGERAVGIVLSGTGSDGTLGLRAIKSAGGLVMAQDPLTAKFDGMPRSAIGTRLVDFVLSPSELRERLLKYKLHPILPSQDPIVGTSSTGKILSMVKEQCGVDFSVYRMSTIKRRIEKRMQLCQITDLAHYVDLLERDSREVQSLYQESLIGVTRFFRDSEAFDALAEHLPDLIKLAEDKNARELRVWSIACSTGEEAYSLAILLTELLDEAACDLPLKIFATDVDKYALRAASAGVYPEAIAADVPGEYLEKYFRHQGTTFTVGEHIRKRVIFSHHNIMKDPPFNRVSLLSCRNFLIYLEPPAQQEVLSLASFSLVENGLLMLGSSETVGELKSHFQSLNHRQRIYQRRPGHGPHRFNLASLGRRRYAAEPAVVPAPKTGIAQPDRHIFNQIMRSFAPPTVVVDDAQNVLMTFGDLRPYFHFPVGQLNYELVSMATDTLGVIMSSAIHRCRKEKQRIVYREFAFSDGQESRLIDIVVEPLGPDKGATPTLFAVVLLDHSKSNTHGADLEAIQLPPAEHLLDLQRELQYTKESLQATIEELETSNEEVQASNEELLASNEELQSTNEELQSVNEELITVNSEYQQKIDELMELNADMANYFNSSDVGTLFLDKELRIRKFSPPVEKHFKLVDTDIGRPLQHFSFGLDYPEFFSDATRVLEDLASVQRKVKGADGNWFLINILPYRTLENRVKGVVISLTNVTEHHITTMEAAEQRDQIAELERERRSHIAALPKRVLIVEDDPDQSSIMAMCMMEDDPDCVVRVAEDGQTALNLLKADVSASAERVDMVMLDLNLPDMHGFEVLTTIKADPELCAIPVVIMTVEADPETVRRAYELQASCFVTKPAAVDNLDTIARAVNQFWFSVVALPVSPGPSGQRASSEVPVR